LDNNDYKELLTKIGDVIESISKLTTRISVIESKLEQIFDLRDDVKEMGEKQIKMEKDINAEFEKIRQLEKRNDELKKYIMGIISGLVVAVVGSLIKVLLGI
jgi:predicted RNase H-like nuclease (RuvC/YqgF family)